MSFLFIKTPPYQRGFQIYTESTGFEPAVSALTGQRVRPGYTTTPTT